MWKQEVEDGPWRKVAFSLEFTEQILEASLNE